MQAYSLKTRNIISTWMNLFFFTVLASYLVYIEFFHDSQLNLDKSNLLETPIDQEIIRDLSSLEFKNRIGNFQIKKEDQNWFMISPRNIPAKKQTIDLILRELKNISISTIHEFEQINIKSFSLDKPIIEMKLHTNKGQMYQVKFGILNRIDNTTYMSFSGKNIIYQTKIFKTPFERFELSDFIDSNVFSMQAQDIKRISIFSGKQAEPRNVLELKGTNWISKKYKQINNDNTTNKVNSILDIKTHMIVDETNESLKNFIQNYLNSPLYKIRIKKSDGKIITYKVTSPTRAINELKIPKRKYFIMTATDRPYPFLISKKYLERFIVRYSDLK